MGEATTVEPLILDLLEWLSLRDRTYNEVMEAWRTSCPRLPVWEEANERGLIKRADAGDVETVKVTAKGEELLDRADRAPRVRL